jgi:peptidoglycan/xylan/chitin deacetylase (PgdA/CDA1 family)
MIAPRPPAGGAAGILAYHRIADPVPGVAPPTWNVTPARFRAQLEGLLARGFRPVPLRTLLVPAPAPAHRFAITFDDGYENVFTAALPILRALSIPATVFVVTGQLGSQSPFPFDDWPAAGSAPATAWRPMSVAQCAAIAADPLFEIGAHTHAHEDFRGRPDALAEDLRTCLGFLADRLSVRQPPFAFPYGSADAALTAVARQAGVSSALTMAEHRIRAGSDPFGWERFLVTGADTAATLAGCLDGWQDTLRRYRPRLGLGAGPQAA